MSGIPLQSSIIYGPILSRRLGRSLGINLMPANRKVCSFDCVYCQYGGTQEVLLSPMRSTLPTPTEIFAAVQAALKKPRSIDYLTFSGNGEPTLHPDFPEIVRGVDEIKGRLRPAAKLAILSNSSRVYDPEIAAALRLIDAPMMKLDAGDEATFQAINRPTGGLTFAMIRGGLGRLPTLMIQSALIDGEVSNVSGAAYEAWVAVLAELRPQKVHLYSAERPTAESGIKCVPPARLERIAKELRDKVGLDARAFWRE